jgi:AcrR family transcriptional regulator
MEGDLQIIGGHPPVQAKFMKMTVPDTAPTLAITVRRPHRADARRNFDALLAAAREAFNRDGIDVPLEDIARQAGVGIATLYRNFPTRSDLVEAVYVSEIEELLQAARDAEEQEPWDALDMWLRRFSGYVATKLAMLQGLNKDSELFRTCRASMFAAATPLFERAQAAGEVRADTNLDDVMRLVSGVTASHYESEEQRARVLALALDAIHIR